MNEYDCFQQPPASNGSDAVAPVVIFPQSSQEISSVTASHMHTSPTQLQLIQTQTGQNVLSRISEDSPRPVIQPKCLNITGIEKYPELQSSLPRSWSVPAFASHIRIHLEAPLVIDFFFLQ